MNDLLYVKEALLPVKELFHKIAEILGLNIQGVAEAGGSFEIFEAPMLDEDVVDRYFTEVVLEWFRKSSSSSCPHVHVTWRNVVIIIAAKEGGNNTQRALVVANSHKGT